MNRESLQFALLGALLSPKTCNEWPRLADMCLEYKMNDLAILCFTNGRYRFTASQDIC